MEIQGNPTLIDDCIGRIQRQTFGRVDNCEESILPIDGTETSFDIRR